MCMMDIFNAAEQAFSRRRCRLSRFLLAVLVLLFCNVPFSWAHPNRINDENSQLICTFDIETAGTLPKIFMVGTTLDGRSAREWKVIDMTQSLNLLHDLDRREHARIKKVLPALLAPSLPHVLAQLKNRGFEQDYNVVLVQGIPSPILISPCPCSLSQAKQIWAEGNLACSGCSELLHHPGQSAGAEYSVVSRGEGSSIQARQF